MAPGLAQGLQALHLPAVANADWLERPHHALDGVLAAAQRAGRGQD